VTSAFHRVSPLALPHAAPPPSPRAPPQVGPCWHYPAAVITRPGAFRLQVAAGAFNAGEIVVLLGENGTGKTTFMKLLCGEVDPDGGKGVFERRRVAYKAQDPADLRARHAGTVQEALASAAAGELPPAEELELVATLLERPVSSLSGGELQRLAIVLALSVDAEVVLMDEPSAYLDAEQRIATCQAIRRCISRTGRTALVVEHDFMMANYLADRVVVFSGEPGRSCALSAPLPVEEGMNSFLAHVGVTFRCDHDSGRPRVNKPQSAKDRAQTRAGTYYVLNAVGED